MPASIAVTLPEGAETVWVVRDRIKFMGEVPGKDLSLLEVEVPPGSGTPPHRHASPEAFRVISGEIKFGDFETTPPRFFVAGPGTVLTVPPNVAHNYQNSGDRPATMVVVVDRSMVTFFHELGRREEPVGGPPSPEEISAVLAACARHQIHLLSGNPA
jgi:quercetin dioxygenase-like cupin family protein